MKIPPPNHTQTPNDLFEEWLPRLKEGELKVLLVIIRKTFGWHKKKDEISLSQLQKYTGLSDSTVSASIDSLLEKNFITKEVTGNPGKQKTTYGLDVDESNNPYPPRISGTPEERGGTPPKLPEKTPPKFGDTKETITKETTTKQRAASPSAAVFSCLKEFSLEQSAIDTLMKFSEAKVQQAVLYLKRKGDKVRSVSGTLIWFCQQEFEPKIPETKEEIIEKNKQWAKEQEKEWVVTRKGFKFEALNSGCELIVGGQIGSYPFKYEDIDMIEQIKQKRG